MRPFEQELERKGCLAGAGVTLNKMQAVSGKPAGSGSIQAGYAGPRAKIVIRLKSYCGE